HKSGFPPQPSPQDSAAPLAVQELVAKSGWAKSLASQRQCLRRKSEAEGQDTKATSVSRLPTAFSLNFEGLSIPREARNRCWVGIVFGIFVAGFNERNCTRRRVLLPGETRQNGYHFARIE